MQIIKLDESAKLALTAYGLSEWQIKLINRPTPNKWIKTRVGRGNKSFEYIPVHITIKVLNMIFGHGWNFTIQKEEIYWEHKQVLVKGNLTVNLTNGKSIAKEQYASKEIQYYSDKPDKYGKKHPRAGEVISIGDDLKGAASLCLTKCASVLGLFSDVYSSEFYSQWEIPDGEEIEENKSNKLFEDTKSLIGKLPKDKRENAIKRAIDSKQFTDEQNEELKIL
jgi:hypothetical protein